MKKTGLSFAAGFFTAVVILSIYSKISNQSAAPTAPVEDKKAEEVTDDPFPNMSASNKELMKVCPAFCENRPDRLEAPEYAKDLPEELKSDFAGGVGLRWNSVKNAVKYRAIVFDRRGERMLALTTKNNRLFFPNLPKAAVGETIELKVAVVAIDKNESEGRMSEKRKLTISGTIPLVRAPKVKMIKVED